MLRVSSGFQTLENRRPRAFISFLVFETPMKHSHSFLKYYLKNSVLGLSTAGCLRLATNCWSVQRLFSNFINEKSGEIKLLLTFIVSFGVFFPLDFLPPIQSHVEAVYFVSILHEEAITSRTVHTVVRLRNNISHLCFI